MNWAIRSRRRAPTALRIPTSTARRVALAVIRVTKLIAAMTMISSPTAAMPASTVRSPGARRPANWGWAVKCRSARGVKGKWTGGGPAGPAKRLSVKARRLAWSASPEVPGFSFT